MAVVGNSQTRGLWICQGALQQIFEYEVKQVEKYECISNVLFF